MSDTGKLTTFFRLINEESSIRIPKVQRDYAYGRDDDKARDILHGMLDTMLAALKDNKQEIFDFVYGGPYAKDDDSQTGMIPLDGQQRLTTLFLLHFYASLFAKDESGTPIDISILKNFSYETRQSANDFRLKLVTDIRDRLLQHDYPSTKTGIMEFIRNDSNFSPAYTYDPTISSMLVVLGEIEKRFADFSDLWEALTERDNLCFYHITLEKFGLTDELYIKMNSRGKKLTEFEIFKADLLDDVKRLSPDKVFDIAKKLDTEWMDMVWDQFPEKPAEADKAYMCLLSNLIRIAHNWFPSNNSIISPRLCSSSEIEFVENVLTFMHDIYLRKGGFENWWAKYYYEDNNVVGKPDKIRLFKIEEPLFVKIMKEQLSVPEIIIFAATYFSSELNLPEDVAFKRLRIIRNLTRANQRANSAHTPHLPIFIQDVKDILTSETLPSTNVSKFIGTSLEEEDRKLRLSYKDYSELLQFENHQILDASLSLFMDKYLAEDSDAAIMISQLTKFVSFFDNDCKSKENFERLRVSFIFKDLEYWQAPVNNDTEDVKRRFFFHAPKDYPSFFFKNRTREHQDEILEVIDRISSPSSLMNNEEKCKEFLISDWQYYMAKYPSANNPATNSGCYGWKDIENRPLEAYILNSTYFEGWNLGWSMMLNILFVQIEKKYLLRWDTHQRPIDISDLGLFIDFAQEGWILSSIDNPERLIEFKNDISALSEAIWNPESMTLTVPHNSKADKDYVETIVDILNLIAKHQQDAVPREDEEV